MKSHHPAWEFSVDDRGPVDLALEPRRRFEASHGLRDRARTDLAFYRETFRIECRIKGLSDEERVRERQEKTAPLLAQFKAWLDHAADAR